MPMPMLKRMWPQRLPESGPGELVSPTSGGSGAGRGEVGPESPIQPWWLWLSAMACEPRYEPGRGEGRRP
jgi:hypothetical protein